MRGYLLVLILLAAVAGGCSRSTLSEYYILTPGPGATSPPGGGAVSIGVGPVTLPGYVDRESISTTDGTQRLTLDENHLWAEPLDENVTRVLAENMATLIGTDRISIHPWPIGSVEYRVKVDVTRMIGQLGGEAWLDARWVIKRDDDPASAPLVSRKTSLKGPAGADYNTLAARFSEMLLALSREITGALPR